MTKPKAILMLSLMLSLTLYSTKTSAQNVTNISWSCLSREQKENIAVCFQENSDCHQALEKATAPTIQDSWEDLLLAGLIGIGAGAVIDSQMHKR